MKHKGWIVTGIVVLSVLAVALIAAMVLVITGHLGSYGTFGLGTKVADKVIFDESYEDVLDISVQSDCGDILLEESTDAKFYVTAFGESAGDIIVKFSEGKLKIDYPKKQKLISFSNVKNNIIIELPSGYAGDIHLESDYGNIRLCSLPYASAEIDCDYGSITLGSINTVGIENDCGDVEIEKAAAADISVNLGSIRVDTVTKSCKLQNDCGDISVKKLAITEDSTITNNLGKITVEQAQGVCVEAVTDLGQLDVRPNDPAAAVLLTIKNDCGDITVKE